MSEEFVLSVKFINYDQNSGEVKSPNCKKFERIITTK